MNKLLIVALLLSAMILLVLVTPVLSGVSVNPEQLSGASVMAQVVPPATGDLPITRTDIPQGLSAASIHPGFNSQPATGPNFTGLDAAGENESVIGCLRTTNVYIRRAVRQQTDDMGFQFTPTGTGPERWNGLFYVGFNSQPATGPNFTGLGTAAHDGIVLVSQWWATITRHKPNPHLLGHDDQAVHYRKGGMITLWLMRDGCKAAIMHQPEHLKPTDAYTSTNVSTTIEGHSQTRWGGFPSTSRAGTTIWTKGGEHYHG